MKAFYLLLIFVMFFVTSCFHCTWVKTGYHYNSDDEYVEEVHYDCPDNNPVEYTPPILIPIINVEFKPQTYYGNKENSYDCTITISNSGNGIAKSVKCSITVTRPDVPGFYSGKTLKFDRAIGDISAGGSADCGFKFYDMAYSGCCMFDVIINITYLDESGKSSSIEKYFGL